MTIEEKRALVAQAMGMLQGASINQLNMFVESGAKVVYQEVGAPAASGSDGDDGHPSEVELSRMVNGVSQVRHYFWGESSMAVIFCVCRDLYGYANNMSQFERDFHCEEGLLANTFRNNPFMRLPIDKWSKQDVKERVLRLVDAYKKAVDAEPVT